jgi:hypothetical protein
MTRPRPHRSRSSLAAAQSKPLLYTSNFASLKSLPPSITPVAVSIGIPGWYKKERELRLAPTRKMLAMSQAGDQDYYDVRYIKILESLDPEEIFESLTLAGTRQVAMLCWCARGETCHRRYVAEWLESYLGIVVPEYGVPRKETETFWEWRDAP